MDRTDDRIRIVTVAGEDEREALCLRILRALPDWFGLPDAVVAYGKEVRGMTVYAAAGPDGAAVGFAALVRHFPESGEIHVMGVLPAHHGGGVGRRLVEACAEHLEADGARFLLVKTLGPSRPDPFYARTTAFYRRIGFLRLEETRDLWEGNPSLILVRPLHPARPAAWEGAGG